MNDMKIGSERENRARGGQFCTFDSMASTIEVTRERERERETRQCCQNDAEGSAIINY